MGALVCRADLVEVYVELGIEYDLPVLFLSRIDDKVRSEYPAIGEAGPRLLAALESRGLPTLDGLAQFYGGETHDERRRNYRRTIESLPPGVSQIIIHCGFDDEELRAVTASASRRDGDRRIFTDDATAKLIEEEGIRLVSWKGLRELRGKPANDDRQGEREEIREQFGFEFCSTDFATRNSSNHWGRASRDPSHIRFGR